MYRTSPLQSLFGASFQNNTIEGNVYGSIGSHNTFYSGLSDADVVARLRPPYKPFPREYQPGSRDDVVQIITTWLRYSSKSLFWLFSGVGVGKTTLARHMVDLLAQTDNLATYYFCDRQPVDDPRELINSMAYELHVRLPDTTSSIADAIRTPTSGSAPLSAYLEKLIIEPIRQILKGTMVIVLDGLDESVHCQAILDALESIHSSSLPTDLRFLISSRPLPVIERSMRDMGVDGFYLQNVEDTVMREFFNRKLAAVKSWENKGPTETQITELVRLADGLYVWAATVCTFIVCDMSGDDPDDNLALVLSLRARSTSEEQLTDLYNVSLAHIFKESQRKKFRKGYSIVYAVEGRLTLDALSLLLKSASLPIKATVQRLRALENASSAPLADSITPISQHFHSSFLDLIVDATRVNPQFLILPANGQSSLVKCCLTTLADWMVHTSDVPEHIRYASLRWPWHLSKVADLAGQLLEHVELFIDQHFAHWLSLFHQSLYHDTQPQTGGNNEFTELKHSDERSVSLRNLTSSDGCTPVDDPLLQALAHIRMTAFQARKAPDDSADSHSTKTTDRLVQFAKLLRSCRSIAPRQCDDAAFSALRDAFMVVPYGRNDLRTTVIDLMTDTLFKRCSGEELDCFVLDTCPDLVINASQLSVFELCLAHQLLRDQLRRPRHLLVANLKEVLDLSIALFQKTVKTATPQDPTALSSLALYFLGKAHFVRFSKLHSRKVVLEKALDAWKQMEYQGGLLSGYWDDAHFEALLQTIKNALWDQACGLASHTLRYAVVNTQNCDSIARLILKRIWRIVNDTSKRRQKSKITTARSILVELTEGTPPNLLHASIQREARVLKQKLNIPVDARDDTPHERKAPPAITRGDSKVDARDDRPRKRKAHLAITGGDSDSDDGMPELQDCPDGSDDEFSFSDTHSDTSSSESDTDSDTSSSEDWMDKRSQRVELSEDSEDY
ncbi:hypothetical protein C8J56DRAFT_1024359 [Mycena floridula]|nr:hypothetical protein C8J56DRAFT_1024359 [Mycena floridula]